MKHPTTDVAVDGLLAADLLPIYRRCADRRYRDTNRLIGVEGVRFVLRAHRAGVRIRGLLVSRRLLTSRAGRTVVKQLRSEGVPTADVTPEVFRQLSSARRASGIAALVEPRMVSLSTMRRQGGLWLGIRRIDAPGNLGTILRTLEAAGGAGVVLFGASTDLYDPAVVRASMGSVFDVAAVRTSHRRFEHHREQLGLQVLGASPSGTRRYDLVDLTKPTLLLLGNERAGLTDEEEQMADALVSIPMKGQQSSVNVASAASVLLFEAARQRWSAR